MERNRRPIRIAIDIAIWQFQSQAGQGGQNPALRTFYYRLLKILALPIHPLFVYDGPKKPLAKRNKVVPRYGSTNLHNEMSKKLLQIFRFPFRTAPGEAEAECAILQREGIVDAVMSQDVDAVMWGSTMTLRDWSQEGTRGNKTATHVNVLRAEETRTTTGLDPAGMILVAILSGGDYAPDGVPGFGPGLACEIAKAHFGTELLQIMSDVDKPKLAEWKERLQYELDTNYSGYFKTKHKSVKIPADFPDETILHYYTHPEVSSPKDLQRLRRELEGAWDGNIDTKELREYVAQTFNWQYRGGAYKYIRSLAPALLAQDFLRGHKNSTISSKNAILERRLHYLTDGMPELRVAAVPAEIVSLNFEEEEDNPEYVQATDDTAAADDEVDRDADSAELEDQSPETVTNSLRPRKKAPWDPRNTQKMWFPETIVKLGLPSLVEEWEQQQRDMLTYPRKFITNKPRQIKSSTAAANRTRPINSYFATVKVTTAGQQARQSLPNEPHKDSVDLQHGRTIHASTTSPRRRKARSKVTKAIPTQPSVNPFSIASQTKPPTTHRAGTDLRPTATTPINGCAHNATRNPTRRNRQPIQKSKTLPSTSKEPIPITSSPPTALSWRSRSSTAGSPPASPAPSPPPPRPVDRQRAKTTTDSPASPPGLSESHRKRTTTRRSITTNPPRQAKTPLNEIFAPSSTTTTTSSAGAAATARRGDQVNNRRTRMVTPRDSLPGTWMDVTDLDGDRIGGGKKQGLPVARVSWVDLTDT